MLDTKLGFGCAPILGRVNKKDSFYALKFAHELGINYFDIARSYGWGEAESLLGKFLKKEQIAREKVEITTKFGLVPHNNQLIRMAKTLARSLTKQIPQSQTIVKSAASKVAPKVEFSVQSTIKSLNESLKALDTDYVDNFLFHSFDFQTKSDIILEIIDLLETQQKLGKIKNYGFATYQSLNILDSFFASNHIRPNLLQIPCQSINQYNPVVLQKFKQKEIKIVMYSPFKLKPTISFIYEQLCHQKILTQVESILGVKIHDAKDIYSILLSYFQTLYSPQVIVISMFNPDHLQKNQQIMQENQLTLRQFQLFESLLVENQIVPSQKVMINPICTK